MQLKYLLKSGLKIDKDIINNNNDLKNKDIFILQYQKGNKISFSHGKYISIKDKKIKYNASTEKCTSDSQINISKIKKFSSIILRKGFSIKN